MKLVTLIIAVSCLCAQITTKNLRIGHYKDVTLSDCGLNAFSALTQQKKCFEWHQTIDEQTQSLRNIKDGRYAVTGEFPYTVLLKRDNPWCTGSIINERWIITAAHCLDNGFWYYNDIKIYVGVTDYPTYWVPTVSANNFILHDNYTGEPDFKHDIALIKLDKKIDINRNTANAVCLPAPDMEESWKHFSGELATLTGWGYVSNNDRNYRGLQMTPLQLSAYNGSERTEIIVVNHTYGSTCQGDSGSPLVQYVNGRAVLIGIYSKIKFRGEDTPCAKIVWASYTAVQYYLNWIKHIIRNN